MIKNIFTAYQVLLQLHVFIVVLLSRCVIKVNGEPARENGFYVGSDEPQHRNLNLFQFGEPIRRVEDQVKIEIETEIGQGQETAAFDNEHNSTNNSTTANINNRLHEQPWYHDVVDPNCGLALNRNSNRPGAENSGFNLDFEPPQSRVIGGNEVLPFSYPFLASLRMCLTCNHICGGSIISKKYILSAAHCVSDIDYVYHSFIVYGNHRVEDVKDPNYDGMTPVKTKDVRIHDLYNDNQQANPVFDLSILTISIDIIFDKFVQPVCLDSADRRAHQKNSGFQVTHDNPEIDLPKSMTVAGWGLKSQDERYTANLGPIYETKVEMLAISLCKSIYQQQSAQKVVITQNMFCTFDPNCQVDKQCNDACQGDSGGPIFYKNPDNEGKLTLLGIISFGVGCGQLKWPAVNTRISSLKTWINNHSEEWREMHGSVNSRPPKLENVNPPELSEEFSNKTNSDFESFADFESISFSDILDSDDNSSSSSNGLDSAVLGVIIAGAVGLLVLVGYLGWKYS